VSKASAKASVDKIRAQLPGLAAARQAIVDAPPPVEERIGRLRESLDAMVSNFEPGLAWAFADEPTGASLPGNLEDLALMIVWLFRDQVEARLIEAAREEVKRRGTPISAEDRAARLAEIDRKRHELEVAEEKLIADAERQGIEIPRRPDASIAAILAVVDEPEA